MQTCTKCGKRSIPGLIRGAGKCRFHWNEGIWGAEWALKCEEDRAADVAKTSSEPINPRKHEDPLPEAPARW